MEYDEQELACDAVFKLLSEMKQAVKEVEKNGYCDEANEELVRRRIADLRIAIYDPNLFSSSSCTKFFSASFLLP